MQNLNTKYTERWSGPKRVKEVVYDAVIEITSGDPNVEFTQKEVCNEVLNKYPDFNERTVRRQIGAACPNSPTSRNYPSITETYYWKVRRGIYRLYNPETDRIK